MKMGWIITALITSVLGVLGGMYFLSKDLDHFMRLSGFFYGGLIVLFLISLMGAFIWAHVVYEQDVEEPKFSVLDLEKGDLK